MNYRGHTLSRRKFIGTAAAGTGAALLGAGAFNGWAENSSKIDSIEFV